MEPIHEAAQKGDGPGLGLWYARGGRFDERAARTGAALRDSSHCGRLQLIGADHLDFLHRMTTNAFTGLEPGRGAEAVFIEQRARIIDLGVFYLHLLLANDHYQTFYLANQF